MQIDTNLNFFYENAFYLTTKAYRMGRLLAHYELYKMCAAIEGDIVEMGVFKGSSLMRFIMFVQLFDKQEKKVIGFDTFDIFPDTQYERDRKEREAFIDETGGGISISKEELENYINVKNFEKYELVRGDILQTVPKYVREHPNMKISLLNIDTDIYEPAKVILELLAPKVVKGGIIIFDDYGVFHGESELADQYCRKNGYTLKNFDFSSHPHYLMK